MIKDAHEVELMRLACQATLKCYEAVFLALQPGMTQNQVSGLVNAAYGRLGFPGFASVQVGEYTALPHGSITPQTIREGTIIMIDDGCTVEGYQSDITRTFVLGKATDKMKKVFDIVHQAQTAALKAAKPGVPLESIDAAGRKVVVDAGYGPGFKYFTHRLGHGMGMDGHEWPYLVKNNMYGWEKALKAAAGHGVQRRTGHLHQGRVRRAARRRHAHHRRRRGAVHAAESVDRAALRRLARALARDGFSLAKWSATALASAERRQQLQPSEMERRRLQPSTMERDGFSRAMERDLPSSPAWLIVALLVLPIRRTSVPPASS